MRLTFMLSGPAGVAVLSNKLGVHTQICIVQSRVAWGEVRPTEPQAHL